MSVRSVVPVVVLSLSGICAMPSCAAESSPLAPLVRILGQTNDASLQADVLRGMQDAFAGRRNVPMPDGWPALYQQLARSGNAEVREKAMVLAVLFGDADALADLRRTVQNEAAAPSLRQNALRALLSKNTDDLVPLLKVSLADRVLRGPALRGLAAFPDPAIPGLILKDYASFNDDQKADAIQTLAARPAFAAALVDAIERGAVPRRDLSAFTVRQMLALKDKQLTAKLNNVWGVLRPPSQEKTAQTPRYKALLTSDYLKSAALSNGRLLYVRTCAACHVLFGEGGKIGPELTGSQRTNLDYLLENLLDPSAVVARDYQVTLLQTKDGRLITGIIKQENDRVVGVQTQNELILIPKNEVEERTRSPLSMMPEGLLANLKNEEVRDLIAYLASPQQAPLPAGASIKQP